MKIAYLISQYPAINHGYLLRETAALRQLGFEILTASVKGPDRGLETLGQEERQAAGDTFYIKNSPWQVWLRAHVLTLVRRPAGWFRGLTAAAKFSGLRPSRLVRQILYFAEAVVFADWVLRQGCRNVHCSFAGNVGVLAKQVFPELRLSLAVYGWGELADPRALPFSIVVEPMSLVRHVSKHGRSQGMLACERRAWARQIRVPLGIDPCMFTPRPFRDQPDPFTILYVGRLSREKGQTVLLLAAARLVQEGRELRVRLVGDGPDMNELRRQVKELRIENSVVFEGRVDDARLRVCYDEADAFVLTSFFEGIPIVLMEAMIRGIPCVAPWITGIPELITTGEEGLLFPPGDESAVARCIAALMDDPALRRRLGEKGREKVLREYDIVRNSEILADAFTACFADRVTDAVPPTKQSAATSPPSIATPGRAGVARR